MDNKKVDAGLNICGVGIFLMVVAMIAVHRLGWPYIPSVSVGIIVFLVGAIIAAVAIRGPKKDIRQ